MSYRWFEFFVFLWNRTIDLFSPCWQFPWNLQSFEEKIDLFSPLFLKSFEILLKQLNGDSQKSCSNDWIDPISLWFHLKFETTNWLFLFSFEIWICLKLTENIEMNWTVCFWNQLKLDCDEISLFNDQLNELDITTIITLKIFLTQSVRVWQLVRRRQIRQNFSRKLSKVEPCGVPLWCRRRAKRWWPQVVDECQGQVMSSIGKVELKSSGSWIGS